MLQRIANLFRRNQDDMECVKTIAYDGIEARISRFPLDCGHPGYLVELFTYLDHKGEWSQCAVFGGRETHAMLPLLNDVAKYLDMVGAQRIVMVEED